MTNPREPADPYAERPSTAAVDEPDAAPTERVLLADRVPADRAVLEHRPPEDGVVHEDRAVPEDGVVHEDRVDPRRVVVDRQREAFGGVKIGSALFGWLTATGTAVILTALLAATGAAIGLGVLEGIAPDQAALPTDTIGWIGAIALLIILFVSYGCGGYVAGRMARFNGAVQGLAVWVWALVIAIVVALLGVVIGSQDETLGNLNSFPRIPLSEGDLTVAGIITAASVLVASLGGAVLGGKAGTHYHRKVDRAGFVDES